MEVCKLSWGLSLELVQYPFHHILLAKAGHEFGLDARGEGVNTLHLLFGGAAKSHCKGMGGE